MPLRTAREMEATLVAHGLASGEQDAITIGGFVVAATNGGGLTLGQVCTVRMRAAGVELTRPDGSVAVTFAYEDLDVLEVSGRGVEGTAGFGGAGGQGSPFVAFISSDQRGPSDAVLRLISGSHRAVLKHPRHSRDKLRRAFAPALARWQSVRGLQATDPALTFDVAVTELERLARLRTTGTISDDEFQTLRIRYVEHLAARAG
jgi:hypothetical protein